MILNTMDETLEEPPRLILNQRDLQMAKVNEIDVDQEFMFTCKATVVSLEDGTGDDGMGNTEVVLELTRIEMQTEEQVRNRPAERTQPVRTQQPQPEQTDRAKQFYNKSY